VRELVAGLPRPAPTVDLAGAIGARIARRPVPVRKGDWKLALPRHRGVALLAGLGLAATVLVAIGIGLRGPRPVQAPEPRSPRPTIVAAEDRPAEPRPATETAPTPLRTASTATGRRATSGPGPESADAAGRARDAETIREMLDSPHLRRIFIVTDVLGGAARDRVEELVQKTPRTEASYGRITVSQGIVIDPRHPNEATVFALVMNEQEQRHFQRRLEQSFPQRVEDTEADPAVVTQLADIGQMTVLPGSPATEVVIPTDVSPQVALRTDPGTPGRQLVKAQISPDFDVSEAAGTGNPAISRERGVSEKTGSPESTPRNRTSRSEPESLLARKDERPSTAGPDEHAVATGSLADASLNARRFREPPAIVLVWVTSL
jgi:hypothetical protein